MTKRTIIFPDETNKKTTTYECLFFILGPEPVAPGEEGVGVGRIEPLEVSQIHTEPNLNLENTRQICCRCDRALLRHNTASGMTLVVKVAELA